MRYMKGSIVLTVRGCEIIMGTEAPTNTELYPLWIDTTDGEILKKWNGTEWVIVNDQKEKFNSVYEYLEVNYFNREESLEKVSEVIASTTITKSNGEEAKMLDLLQDLDENSEKTTEEMTTIKTSVSKLEHTSSSLSSEMIDIKSKVNVQVFYYNPEPPYNVGDLWYAQDVGYIEGEENPVFGYYYPKRCVVSKAEGEKFEETDWEDVEAEETDDALGMMSLMTCSQLYQSSQTLYSFMYNSQGEFSKIEQLNDKVSLLVGDTDSSSSINLTSEFIEAISEKIFIDGSVTFTNAVSQQVAESEIIKKITTENETDSTTIDGDKIVSYGSSGNKITIEDGTVQINVGTNSSSSKVGVKINSSSSYMNLKGNGLTIGVVGATSYVSIEPQKIGLYSKGIFKGGLGVSLSDVGKLCLQCDEIIAVDSNINIKSNLIAEKDIYINSSYSIRPNSTTSSSCLGADSYRFFCLYVAHINASGNVTVSGTTQLNNTLTVRGRIIANGGITTSDDFIMTDGNICLNLEDGGYGDSNAIKWKTIGGSDSAKIVAGSWSENQGFLELSVSDDGNEEIYVAKRNYEGGFSARASLLDSSSNTSFPNKLSAGSLSISGVSTLNSSLTVNGTTTLNSSLAVSGSSTLTNLTVTSLTYLNALSVTNGTSIGGTLTVSGATTINSTLTMGNNILFKGSYDIRPNSANCNCWLGNSDYRFTYLYVKNINASSVLTVSGATTLSSTLTVSGATTINSTLTMGNNILFNGSYDIRPNSANYNCWLGSSSYRFTCLYVKNIDASGTASISSSLTVGSTLTVNGATTVNGAINGLKITTSDWVSYLNVYDSSYSSMCFLQYTGSVDMYPQNTGNGSIGTSSNRFYAVHANTFYGSGGASTTSDKNKKKDVKEVSEDFVDNLIDNLKLKSYKYIDGTSGRTHYGAIAQEVEEVIENLGITSQEFGAIVKEYPKKVVQEDNEKVPSLVEDTEAEPTYYLRYEQFIMPLVQYCQSLKKRIENLEKQYKEQNS